LKIKLKSGIDDVTTKLNGMLEDGMNSVNYRTRPKRRIKEALKWNYETGTRIKSPLAERRNTYISS
jgi:hypothetical protein